MSRALQLTKDLINKPSVTPDDQGCQQLISDHLTPLGFVSENQRYGDVDNLWIRRGNTHPLFVFAGHTDVVPAGDLNSWDTDPFVATEIDGKLYGRGAADMKASIAAMMIAIEKFTTQHPNHKGSIALLITSDEEGVATHGTCKVIETLENRAEKIDWCLVGEPSSTNTLGDVVKVGRRGSLNAKLVIHGKQGHIAYPHLADNPIHKALGALKVLSERQWDHGNELFPPTSFQISNINSGTGATNVIPANVEVLFNFRFCTESTHQQLRSAVEKVLNDEELDYSIDWTLSGEPFLTKSDTLIKATQDAIKSVVSIDTELSTSGGTSDGRFIAPTGAEILELGPINATIHKVNECVNVKDIDDLAIIYQKILENLLTTDS